jgi:putative holliday junction resolvase
MGRILSIDYGNKRVGLAVTDELQIVANGLATIHSKDVLDYLIKYIAREHVELIIVGEPRDMQGRPSDASRFIEPFVKKLIKQFPSIPVKRIDERFTSKMAFQTMLEAGLGKKARQNKALVDTISATIILQSYLEQQSNAAKRS